MHVWTVSFIHSPNPSATWDRGHKADVSAARCKEVLMASHNGQQQCPLNTKSSWGSCTVASSSSYPPRILRAPWPRVFLRGASRGICLTWSLPGIKTADLVTGETAVGGREGDRKGAGTRDARACEADVPRPTNRFPREKYRVCAAGLQRRTAPASYNAVRRRASCEGVRS